MTKSNKKKRKGLRILGWATFILMFIGMLGIFVSTLYISQRLFPVPIVDTQYLTTYETSRIVDKNGDTIWQPIDRRVATMDYEQIPDVYKTALLAAEDEHYWTNKGFSIKGVINMVGGVVYSKINPTYIPRGGSTIEQQLIKNKYYNGGQGHETTTRKIQELFLARQLDANFTKEQILTFYVNSLEYAEGATGVKAAMQAYFGKGPDDYKERTIVNIAEQAYIAGLSQAPTRYNLYNDVEAANNRKNTVLQRMFEIGELTENETKKAQSYDVSDGLLARSRESSQQHQLNLKYKAYTDEVIKEMRTMGYNIEELTVTIKTYLDPKQYDSITNMVRNDQYYLDGNQQIAVTVMDADGIVVGLVGGRHATDELNRAVQTARSSGSSMKPFTAYGPLLQYMGDTYNTSSKFDTSNYQYPGSTAVMHNWGQYTYGQQTMQESLRQSYNTVVGRIDDQLLGSTRIKTFLHGVGADVQDTYTSVDGIGLNLSTVHEAAAYNTLNNLGEYTKPRYIQEILFTDGSKKELVPEKRRAMNASTAWTLNHILRGVPTPKYTASAAEIKEYQGYAGKTGTVGFDANIQAPAPYGYGASDAWYTSYTNKGYTVAIWTGYDKPNTSPQIPDTYKGYQTLNRDLQRMLNGNKSVPNWEKPETVKVLSGKGIDMKVAITDASPLLNVQPSQWADIKQYDSSLVNAFVPSATVAPDWKETESNPFFEYYQSGGPFPPVVIDSHVYNQLQGGQ